MPTHPGSVNHENGIERTTTPRRARWYGVRTRSSDALGVGRRFPTTFLLTRTRATFCRNPRRCSEVFARGRVTPGLGVEPSGWSGGMSAGAAPRPMGAARGMRFRTSRHTSAARPRSVRGATMWLALAAVACVGSAFVYDRALVAGGAGDRTRVPHPGARGPAPVAPGTPVASQPVAIRRRQLPAPGRRHGGRVERGDERR